MHFLGSMNVGDRFRVAHPRQISLNRRTMSRDLTFQVTKVYEQTPRLIVAKVVGDGEGIYSLNPGTPVLYPAAPNPTELQVFEFLSRRTTRKKVVAYRMLWDGSTDLVQLLSPLGRAVIRTLYVLGSKEIDVKDAATLVRENLPQFLERGIKMPVGFALKNYRRYLVEKGMLEEIVGEPTVPDSVVDANLQEYMYDGQ